MITCKECIYSSKMLAQLHDAKKGQPAGQLICRIDPPRGQGMLVPVPNSPGGAAISVITVWPQVGEGDWCGKAEKTSDLAY